MRKVSEKDWEETSYPYPGNVFFFRLIDGQGSYLHLSFISLLYKRYRLGDWNNKIPDPKTIPDKKYLMWDYEAYCIFHKHHPKFGKHIIECANTYGKNMFVFFDFFSVKLAFEALDRDQTPPYIPTYYAHPYDRHDYQTGRHEWE